MSEIRFREKYESNKSTYGTRSEAPEHIEDLPTKGTGYYSVLALTLALFFTASKVIFDNVYDASKTVVDELYHVPQGLAYCAHNFSHWDPKITTLPGLYLISASIVSACCECNLYNLRSVNLYAALINLCLFSSIFKYIYGVRNSGFWTAVLQGLNLCILPPLYFFSHLYYTDILSLTCTLSLFRLCLASKHKMVMLILGVLSVVMRQTNAVWIAMVLGHRALDVFVRSSRVYGNIAINPKPFCKDPEFLQKVDSSKVKRYYNILDLYVAIKYHASHCFVTFFKAITSQDWKVFATHGSILAAFAIFVISNGSIVVGDKTAHAASFHLPQLLYFLLFYGFFALPFVVASVGRTLTFMSKNKALVLILSIAFVSLVEFNTIIHPYLLADNRHYTFYLWNRWFNRYWFAKYATVPVYVFLFFSLYVNLKEQNCVSFLVPFSVCTVAALGLQRMIEVRYFLMPFIVLRMRFPRASLAVMASETVWYLVVNAAAFYVFFSKEFMWIDFEDPQRIIW